MNKTTYFRRVNYCKYGFEYMPIETVLEEIQKGSLQLFDDKLGSYSLQMITEAIRQNPDKNRQNLLKEVYLPAVCFNGIWNGREIIDYSSYTALDFDYIGSESEMMAVIALLKNTPFVLAVFRTFKPYRLKAIVKHDNQDKMLHKDMYEQLMKTFGIQQLDTDCKDLSRRNYLVWDNDIWINPNPIAYHYTPPLPQAPTFQISTNNGKGKSPQSIINILNSSWKKNHPEYWQEGNRAKSIFLCACQFCKYGVPKDMAEDYFVNGWVATGMGRDEIVKQVRGAYAREIFDSKLFI